jgi:hypothetical protein
MRSISTSVPEIWVKDEVADLIKSLGLRVNPQSKRSEASCPKLQKEDDADVQQSQLA